MYKDIDTYYIGYFPIGDCEKIYSVNTSYLITGEVNGHIECNSIKCEKN